MAGFEETNMLSKDDKDGIIEFLKMRLIEIRDGLDNMPFVKIDNHAESNCPGDCDCLTCIGCPIDEDADKDADEEFYIDTSEMKDLIDRTLADVSF